MKIDYAMSRTCFTEYDFFRWIARFLECSLSAAGANFGICDALRDLVPFVQFKNLKNTHRVVLLLVKLQAKSLQLY